MDDEQDKNLLNYVKNFQIPKNEPKYEDRHILIPLPKKNKSKDKEKLYPSSKRSTKHKKSSSAMKLNSNEYNFNKTNYQFNLNNKISFQKKSNKNINKKEDKKEPNLNIRKKKKVINYDELIKKMEETNRVIKEQIQRRENNIYQYQKKYEDQENIIKNLELILSELKDENKKNFTSKENEEKNIDLINSILASEIDNQEIYNDDNDILYDEKFQEQLAINAVDQQIIDELYPNPDAMSYEQLLQLEDNMGKVNKGLNSKQIDTLPYIKYDKKKYSENYQCIICMEEFVKKEKLKLLPCGHIFHDNCIKQWLLKEKTCPFCKSEIK